MERSRLTAILGILLILTLWAGRTRAQEPPEDAALNRLPEPTRQVSLEEVTRLALSNNLDIQIIKYDTYISRTGKGAAESIYDTLLKADVGYANDQSARTSSLQGTKALTNTYNIGVERKLPTGTTVSVDMGNERSWTNSSFVTLNPSHDSSLGVTVEQELGKNFFGMQDRGGVKIALLDIANAQFTSLGKIETLLADVQNAYWDLALKYEQLKIEEGMIEQAKKLLDLHREKIEVGLVESPELLASEANYNRRVNEYLLAQNRVQTSSNVLRLLLNIDENVLLEPAEVFTAGDQEEDRARSLQKAFEQRQDYKRSKKDLEARDINIVMKRNNTWPEINVSASLAQNGISDSSFSQAAEKITSENNPDLSVGLEFRMPLENRKARSELKSAEFEKAKSLVQLKLLERQITINVTDQVRTVNILRELTGNEERIARLEEEKLRAEEERFNQGRSDTDTVIRFQEDLLQAKLREAQAKYAYNSAVVQLRQREGSLVQEYFEGEI